MIPCSPSIDYGTSCHLYAKKSRLARKKPTSSSSQRNRRRTSFTADAELVSHIDVAILALQAAAHVHRSHRVRRLVHLPAAPAQRASHGAFAARPCPRVKAHLVQVLAASRAAPDGALRVLVVEVHVADGALALDRLAVLGVGVGAALRELVVDLPELAAEEPELVDQVVRGLENTMQYLREGSGVSILQVP